MRTNGIGSKNQSTTLSSLQVTHGHFYLADTIIFVSFPKQQAFISRNKIQWLPPLQNRSEEWSQEVGTVLQKIRRAASRHRCQVLPRCAWQQRAQVTLLALGGGRDFICDKHSEHS